MRKQAHSLKGAAKNLGAERIASVALRLEKMVPDGEVSGAEHVLRAIEEEVERVKAYIS